MVAPVLIAIAAAVVAVALTVIFLRPKRQKPAEVQDAENPVAEAGKPVPVPFGTISIKGLNVLWYGDKNKYTYTKKQGGGK